MRGIEAIRPGATTGDIGYAIQDYAERERCSVVRDFCGHGVGRLFHDVPNILHYGSARRRRPLKPGMIFTVEPMINLGRPQVKILSDGWTAVTRDRSLSAQFEHTVGVTETGYEIFTLSPKGLAPPRQTEHDRLSRKGRGCPPFHRPSRAPEDRFREAGGEALPDYELLELILFQVIPRRDTKPIAKALLAAFRQLLRGARRAGGAPPRGRRRRRSRRPSPEGHPGRGPALRPRSDPRAAAARTRGRR